MTFNKIITTIGNITQTSVNFLNYAAAHGQWTFDEGFFSKISQITGRFWRMGRINCGVFWVFSAEQILSLCFPSPQFSNNQPLFIQKN